MKNKKLEFEGIYYSEAELQITSIPGLKIIYEEVLPSIKRVKEEYEAQEIDSRKTNKS